MILSGIWSAIGKAMISLLLVLDSFVYSFVSSSYKIFMALAGAKLLASDSFSEIANNIYILIGVVMLFVLSYAIIKAIIDPDQMTKGELGGPKILKSILVAVIGLGITPVIFNMLYQAQGLILENDIIGKVFFRTDDPSNKVTTSDVTVTDDQGNSYTYGGQSYIPDDYIDSTGGAVVATSVWQSFFYPSSGNMDDADNIESAANDYFLSDGLVGAGCAALTIAALVAGGFTFGIGTILIGGAGAAVCVAAKDAADQAIAAAAGDTITLNEAYTMSSSGGDFGVYTNFVDEIVGDENTIEYKFIVSTIIGGFVVYAFFSFAIDMGVRCAKLAYYQIIAPIPLILQILPKFKDSFNKYIKNVIATFLEVFIRVSVVYLVVYILCHITDLFSVKNGWANLGPVESMFARTALIVGLVLFAKQAPKIIQDTFGIQPGSMSLGIGKKLADGGVFAAGAIVGGGVRQFATNARSQWGKDEGTHNGRASRFARAIGSGFAGAGSAMARSTRDQFFGPNHKQAMSWSDMKNQIDKSWDAANAAKTKRDDNDKAVELKAQELAGTGNPVTARHRAMARVMLGYEKVGDTANTWTTATIDTSYQDRTISLLQSMMDERDKLRTKTGKVEDTRLVGKMLESLQAEKIQEFDEEGYKAAVQAAVDNVGPRSAFASDAAYSAALKAAADSVDRNKFVNQNYAEEVAALQRKTNGMAKLQEAVQDLNALGLMIKGDAGVQAELQDYITANWSDLQSRLNEVIDLGDDGTITMKQMLENAGVDTKTGIVKFASAEFKAGTKIVTDVEVQRKDSSGNLMWVMDPATGSPKLDSDGNRIPVMEVQKVSYDVVIDESTGQIREVQQKDSSGNVTFSESLSKFMERVKNADNIVNVSAKSSINTLNDQAKDGKNNILRSEEYIRTQQRKIDQQKKKNGN